MNEGENKHENGSGADGVGGRLRPQSAGVRVSNL